MLGFCSTAKKYCICCCWSPPPANLTPSATTGTQGQSHTQQVSAAAGEGPRSAAGRALRRSSAAAPDVAVGGAAAGRAIAPEELCDGADAFGAAVHEEEGEPLLEVLRREEELDLEGKGIVSWHVKGKYEVFPKQIG